MKPAAIRAGLIGLALLLAGCAPSFRDTAQPMTTVADLDVARYAGRWYEVASFSVFFQRGCTATTADYDLRADGVIGVVNTCRRDNTDGPVSQIAGTARVVGQGQLQVRLGRVPFPGDYWVLWVAPDYRTAVVGVPSGRAGWVLHRTPEIPAARLDEARAVLAANGYDLNQLLMTRH